MYGDESDGETQKRPRFQGLLSIGVEQGLQHAGRLGAPYLMKDLSKLIKELDEAAKPTDSISVVRLGSGANAQQLEIAVTKLMGDPSKLGTSPGRGQPGQPGQPAPGASRQPRRPRKLRLGRSQNGYRRV